MRTANKKHNAYAQNNVSVESSEKLILMLPRRALRFISQAKIAIENNDIEKRSYWINRTTMIFIELINSLEYSAGDVAYYLQGLYTQEIKLLMDANSNGDIEKLNEVTHVLKELSAAWKENVLKVNNENLDQ